VGGMHGWARGKTKLECYKDFRRQVDRRDVEESTGLFMDAGTGTKSGLYSQMKKDPETGDWILYYHFGK
jgi:hypothetical protein